MKYIKYCLYSTFLLASASLPISCTNELEETEVQQDAAKTVRMKFAMDLDNYDETSTRASRSWSDGDKLYISANGINGTATYRSGGWTLSYQGSLNGEAKCSVYYFTDATTDGSDNIVLTPESSVFADNAGKLSSAADEVTLTGTLKPKAARLRFKESNGTDIKISGLTAYTKFTPSSATLATAKLENHVVTVSVDYTPYIYVACEGSNQDVTIDVKGNRYSHTFTSTKLTGGKSGYVQTPTKENLDGWTFLGETPAPKWDGKMASEFAGGKGTSYDPYQIETGGQLLLMKDYSDKYFVLNGNIDLDNKNWLPFDFMGNLDGKGFMIKNLYIKRTTDKQGLFSTIDKNAVVKNLTIKGGKIEADGCKHVGALAGKVGQINSSSEISNCHVIFTSDSKVIGGEGVGGMFGYVSTIIIDNCTVISEDNSAFISGELSVGGLVGHSYENTITNCHVSINLNGGERVGGICGFFSKDTPSHSAHICSSSATGTYVGTDMVGGIVGDSYRGNGQYIQACKADVNITTERYGGGICGFNGNITACYAKGTIKSNASYDSNYHYLYGIGGSTTEHSYSTITCDNANFVGISNGSNSYSATTSPTMYTGTNSGSCTDITTFLRECYQTDYDKYWNYDNTWTWEGTINGKSVKVSCPKLAWEE